MIIKRQRKLDSNEWITTFADLMTLLLCFFILLWSFAKMDVGKFKDAMESIQGALNASVPVAAGIISKGPVSEPATFYPTIEHPSEKENRQKKINALMAEDLNQSILKMGLTNEINVDVGVRGVILQVKGQLLFASGTANLKPESFPIMDQVHLLFNRMTKMKMAIEGHTDNIAINTKQFSSNWELSTERAFSVFRYFRGKGLQENRIDYIAGFADTSPIDSNYSPEGRAKNRRVTFVFSER